MNKAVFLDLDGTLVESYGWEHKIENFKLLPKVIEGLKILSDKFIFIIVSNQSGIARGFCTKENIENFNNKLLNELNKNNIHISKTYFCPHHPDDNCECRKPKLGMINKAVKEFNLDLKNSYFIGDKTSDIKCGENAGCKTILVKTGSAGKDRLYEVKPNFIAENLFEAAKIILNKK